MPRHLKMFNKHVLCQLSITHQSYSMVKSHRIEKVEEIEIIVIEYKVL